MSENKITSLQRDPHRALGSPAVASRQEGVKEFPLSGMKG